MEDGYIKFDLDWQSAAPPAVAEVEAIDTYRQKLYDHRWIGYDPRLSVGYGNISRRGHSGQGGLFLISGTRTGAVPQLGPEHYTWITHYDLSANQVRCQGPIQASAETMTHAAAYEASPRIEAVLHIHHRAAWQAMRDLWPTTDPAVPYGTPDMAYAVRDLLCDLDPAQPQVIVMGGHPEGLLATGPGLEAAYQALVQAMQGCAK
jgi:L-ribulose-5-phosphate 4-epimerase